LITPDQIANAIREERLQCAVEMCLEIYQDNLQLTCVEGLISETVGDANLPASLVDLQRVRINQPRDKYSLISVVSQALLEMPYCRRASPMSNFEKLDLLEKVRLEFISDDREGLIIDKILQIVRSDENLTRIPLRQVAPEMQGLILFLGHNDSPSRVIELKKDDFSGLTSEGLMVAVFMVGLRFRRQTLPGSQVFAPLRDTQIRKVVAILNGSTPPEPAVVRRDGRRVFINNVIYVRRIRSFVLQGPFPVVYGGAKGDFSKFVKVKMISIKNLDSIGPVKIKQLPILKNEFIDTVRKSINFEDFKEGKIRVFNNRQFDDSYFDFVKFLEVKFKSEVWIHDNGESPTKLKNIVLRFMLTDVQQILSNAQSSERPKKSVTKRHIEGQLFPLTGDVSGNPSDDDERNRRYWKKEFRSLFKMGSGKIQLISDLIDTVNN